MKVEITAFYFYLRTVVVSRVLGGRWSERTL